MSQKRKILYTDDEDINLKLFEYNFSKRHEVITAISPSEGLDCLEKFPNIQVVISDMRMPEMNGLEFIAKAKEIYSDKKYFILTGFDITDEIRDALDSHLINKYFQKPLNINEIEAAIDELN